MADQKVEPDATEQRPAEDVAEVAAVERAATPEMPARVAVTREQIAAIVPRGMERVGECCLIRGMTLEETRAILLEEHAKKFPPVGTPEAPEPQFRAVGPIKAQPAPGVVVGAESWDKAEMKRALTGL